MIMQSRSMSALRSKVIRAAFGVCFVGFGTASATAQGSPPAATPLGAAASAIEAKLNAAVKEFSHDPRFKGLSQQQIRDRVEFVTGNVIFATVHEVGHMVVTELGLPVLGREEDAADSYAVVTMLKVGDTLSDNILIQSARGWFMSDARAKKQKATVVFYDVARPRPATRLQHRVPDGRKRSGEIFQSRRFNQDAGGAAGDLSGRLQQCLLVVGEGADAPHSQARSGQNPDRREVW